MIDDNMNGFESFIQQGGRNPLIRREITKIVLENPLPKKYIINENACICFWNNGDKTISKRHKEDIFDKEIGFLHACWQHYNKDKSKNFRKKILSCIKQERMKDFLFEKFRAENNMTVEQAKKYLKDLKMEVSNGKD